MVAKGRVSVKLEDELEVVLSGKYAENWVHDVATHQLLKQVLTTLKKIEFHLSIASDTNLEDQDV